MTKKTTFRLIGLFALTSGVIVFWSVISNAITIPSSWSIQTINSLVVAWVTIYGGYQTIRLRVIGRKLLQVSFTFKALITLLYVIIFASWVGTTSLNSVRFETPAPRTILLILLDSGLSISYLLALILLLRKEAADHFQAENSRRHVEIVGKTLSLVAPGWGSALVGNTLVGLGLFYVYGFFTAGLSLSGFGRVGDLIVRALTWLVFVVVDWNLVIYKMESSERSLPAAPLPNPGETNG